MALVLIFICSMIGLFMAAVDVVILNNGMWQAALTYLTFAVAYPTMLFLLLLALDWARGHLTAPQAQDTTDARHSA